MQRVLRLVNKFGSHDDSWDVGWHAQGTPVSANGFYRLLGEPKTSFKASQSLLVSRLKGTPTTEADSQRLTRPEEQLWRCGASADLSRTSHLGFSCSEVDLGLKGAQ